MPAHNHVHKYERVDIGVRKPWIVYQCVLSSCFHYLPVRQMLRRQMICWGCGDTTVIEPYHLKYKIVHPKCIACRKNVKISGDMSIEEILGKVGGGKK